MSIDNSECLDLQKRGALARALGRHQSDNPFLKSENLPASTGETPEVWEAKHDSWHLGWVAENAIRGDRRL